MLLAELIPWQELEEAYAPQFSVNVGAPAKPVRLEFGSLYIKQRLGLTDEETVLPIQENPYMQFFLGFSGYSNKVPFDPSMMVHFGGAPSSGVSQEVLCPFLEGEQEQSEDDWLEAHCAAPLIHYAH